MADIEEHIRRALEDGKFKDLPGKGKPLNLDENPLEDPEWRVAHHILQNGGFTLPWIETRQEIEAALEAARQDLARAWAARQSAPARQIVPAIAEGEWGRAVHAFNERMAAINKLIRDYNLEAPSSTFHLVPVKVEREMERITGRTA